MNGNNSNNNNESNIGNSKSNSVEQRQSPTKIATSREECIVCFKDVEIFSIGECDHPVCYECSTRMRVLCQQNECPICRHNLAKVIFTTEKLPYRELETKNRQEYYSRRYKIGFCTAEIQKAFFKLLDHPCPKCNTMPYRTFQALKNHVRKEHDRHYCDICTEHLKIFTFERRCYTQSELGIHRSRGDVDNTSHRGHPMCEYCKQRYLDQYELFRHLRREHYFCHFCDADGLNEFYGDYDSLADHFRRDHFLCEEGRCATDQFVGAFRTEIDFKAHVANVHGKNLTKQQAKQTRTLQLEITLGPRSRSGANEGHVASMRNRGNAPEEDLAPNVASQGTSIQRPVAIDAGNEEEFPSLAGTTPGPSVSLAPPLPQSLRIHGTRAGLARTKENFPALGESRGGGGLPQNKAMPISSVMKKAAAANSQMGAVPRNTNNTTSTSATATASINGNTSGMVIHVSNRPSSTANNASVVKNSAIDFPALPSSSTKSKKHARIVDSEEVLLPPSSQVSLAPISAKHRSLIDDYVSVANPSHFQKIQMVQKEVVEAKTIKAEKSNAPKLTVDEFPSLASSNVNGNNVGIGPWTKQCPSKKTREQTESRKLKVTPPPPPPTGKRDSNSTTDSINKKEKDKEKDKDKDKRKKPLTALTANTPAIKAGNSTKMKEKEKEKNNNENKSKNANLINGDLQQVASTHQIPMHPTFDFKAQQNPLKPPPGFHADVTVNSLAKLPNSLTFTSSLGQSYDIVPTTFSYIQPADAAKRNQKLVNVLKETLNNPEALQEFRTISQRFREGLYKAPAYYEHCKAALNHSFNQVFPELLALLPDISKQQALYLVHSQYLCTMDPNQRKLLPKLEVCSTCKQVVLDNDVPYHQKVHMHSTNFPAIGSTNGKTGVANRKS